MSAPSRLTPRFVVLLAAIGAAPLPLGANRPWALAVLGSVLLAVAAWQLLRPEAVTGADEEPLWRARRMMGALGLWTGLVAVQLVPLPAVLAQALGGTAGGPPTPSGWHAITIDRHSTELYLLKACALLAGMWLVLTLARSPRRIEALAWALIVGGTVQAVIGITLLAAGGSYTWFFVRIGYGTASGTFVNHNHFAGWLELALASGIGLMIARLEPARTRDWRRRVRDGLALMVSSKVRLRLMLLVMVIALIASRSRMGNGAFFLSLSAVGALAIVLSRRSPRAIAVFIGSLLVLDIVVVGSVVGLERVIERMEQTRVLNDAGTAGTGNAMPGTGAAVAGSLGQETLEQRTEAARHALALVRGSPLLGMGGGTFHLAFPKVQPPELRGYFDHAHNDYAEFAADTGLVGLVLLAAAVVLTLVEAVRILVRRRDPLARGMAVATLMGLTSLLLHALVDFNLQIPSNALAFVVLMTFPFLVGSRPTRQRRPGADLIRMGSAT